MDFPVIPVGNLEILISVDPPRGGIIFQKLKNPTFPHMALDGGRNPFVAPFAQLLEDGKKDIQIQNHELSLSLIRAHVRTNV